MVAAIASFDASPVAETVLSTARAPILVARRCSAGSSAAFDLAYQHSKISLMRRLRTLSFPSL